MKTITMNTSTAQLPVPSRAATHAPDSAVVDLDQESHRRFGTAIASINLIVVVYAFAVLNLASTSEEQTAAVMLAIGAMFLLVILDAVAFAIALGW